MNPDYKKLEVKTIIANKMKCVFNRRNFCLTGIYNKDEVDIFETRHNHIIELFGGNLYEDFTEDNDIILTKVFRGRNNFFIFFYFYFLNK